jgi:mono/diheme cytochrome c family protein
MLFKYSAISTFFFFTGLISLSAQQQVWDIPKDADQKTAPFVFKDSTRKAGESIFTLNCKSCHGEPGKASNNKQMVPLPRDPASPEYQKHSDGALFYIITTGRGLMQTFENVLTENQRWYVISYVRSFNKDYVQAPVKSDKTAEIASTIKMTISFDEKKESIVASILDKLDGKIVPVSNVLVKLFVKKTFGNLPIGQAITGENGKAFIKFPSDMPGDTSGNMMLVAIAGTTGKQIMVEKSEQVGTAINPSKLLDERAMWNVRSKAPLWLIISYLCGGIAVACAVSYVFLQLKKIKDLNQINNSGHE